MSNINSTRYTILFATTVCVVCAALVATAAVSLKPAQVANARLYMEKNVLVAASLAEHGQPFTVPQVQAVFERDIKVRLVDLATGELVPEDQVDARRYDQRAARNDPATSRAAPANNAGIRRLPNRGLVYYIMKDGQVDQVVVPVEGLGMWGTIYGFLSLAPDGNTVRGLTYYEHRETPGLGAEISNPDWLALWRGRKGYDEQGAVAVRVIKGPAGKPDDDPNHVDGLSGATVTGNAVTQLMQYWLGANGYGKFLQQIREGAPA
ncbi:MAG: Na(+)-translocating NADH-quinone reductase subunit C [Rubrivivax sp.]|nr:Na(+)-translocating NADH-quinone reductase subunit C [Rubrivivax sp.]